MKKKKNIAQMHVSKHFQKIIKNISKMIFEKFFLHLLLFLFDETFLHQQNLSFQDEEKCFKSRFSHKFVLFNKY